MDTLDQLKRAEHAIAAGSRDPALYNTLAWGRLQENDPAAAFALLQAALTIAPRDPQTLTNLAMLLRQQGQLRDAILHCDAALAADPANIAAWLERGFILTTGGASADAAFCYGKVLALDPRNADAHAGLAAHAVTIGEHVTGRSHARSALDVSPENVVATAALASIELDQGHTDAARILLEPFLARLTAPSADRSLLSSLLGDACDRLGEPDRAYSCYVQSQSDYAVLNGGRGGVGPSHREVVEKITAEIEAIDASMWHGTAAPTSDVHPRHLFLLGYPRSGNTLVENILASIPGVAALEERPTLREAKVDFYVPDGGLKTFACLPDRDLDRYRDAYWSRVEAAGIPRDRTCFVDMDPVKSMSLPLIARLFPQARIVLVRRDPRDVVWSCFHTHFALSHVSLEFTTLESTARHYDAMMRLVQISLERLPLNVHVVHYHRLVHDFDATTKTLCDFSGLPWSEHLRSFDKTAQKRGVSTASVGQVRKGLYDGTRQWVRYEQYLEPVMPLLQPWIEAFGYGD